MHFTDAPLPRSGRMTAQQKVRRAELEAGFGRPDPKAVQNATYELVSQALLGRVCHQTPAMLRQMVERVLTASDVLAKRLFVTHLELGQRWSDDYYWRRVTTMALPVNRRHTLSYAF